MSGSCRLGCVSALALSLGIASAFGVAEAKKAESNRGWWVVLGAVATPDNIFSPETTTPSIVSQLPLAAVD